LRTDFCASTHCSSASNPDCSCQASQTYSAAVLAKLRSTVMLLTFCFAFEWLSFSMALSGHPGLLGGNPFVGTSMILRRDASWSTIGQLYRREGVFSMRGFKPNYIAIAVGDDQNIFMKVFARTWCVRPQSHVCPSFS
jgi:hypothetical protein